MSMVLVNTVFSQWTEYASQAMKSPPKQSIIEQHIQNLKVVLFFAYNFCSGHFKFRVQWKQGLDSQKIENMAK